MKRIIVLLVVALMSSVMLNAKNVRGYVSDKDGNPVAGMKMVMRNADQAGHSPVVTVTDADGHFSVNVPNDMDVIDLREVFARKDMTVVKYWVTPTGQLRIVVDSAGKK